MVLIKIIGLIDTPPVNRGIFRLGEDASKARFDPCRIPAMGISRSLMPVPFYLTTSTIVGALGQHLAGINAPTAWLGFSRDAGIFLSHSLLEFLFYTTHIWRQFR